MLRSAIFPNRYVQGRDAIGSIADFTGPLGKVALLLADRNVRSFVEPAVTNALSTAGINLSTTQFEGECNWREIDRVAAEAKAHEAQVIIGAGGGKTMDTTKAAAEKSGCRIILVPTTASSDAPTSALAVIYTDEGEFSEYHFLPRNPDVVLMDSQIIANAPVRSLISGIGDALATWFEADATAKSGGATMSGGMQTKAGHAIARLCYDTLIEFGQSAVMAAAEKIVTPALEQIIEANTLLSGVGFESGGLAAAHSIHNGLTAIPETHKALHGEKVAFGTLVQVILENKSTDEIDNLISFMLTVGLPTTLESIGLVNATRDKIQKAAEVATRDEESIYNEPFRVTAEDVRDAIIAADGLGRSFTEVMELTQAA